MKFSACRKALTPLFFSGTVLLSTHVLAQAGSIAEPDPDGALDRSYPELQRVTPQAMSQSVSQGSPQATAQNLRPANAGTTLLSVASSNGQTANGQSSNGQVTAPFDLDQIRSEVQREQTALEQLDRTTLRIRAEQGERAAQVALGVDFAQESALLSFAPAAANDALSDAVRWYSLAAQRGYPGTPSLDQAGVRYFPVRVVRESSR